MSFDIPSNKPRLIEKKVVNFYLDKNKISNRVSETSKVLEKKPEISSKVLEKKPEISNRVSETSKVLEKNPEISNKVSETEIKEDKFHVKIGKSLWLFIKQNYGFFLIITLITLLLYIRYLETKKKKNKYKKIMLSNDLENLL